MAKKKEKTFISLQDVIDTMFKPFNSLDVCQLCGGYDTIQTYIIFKDNRKDITFHICENCCEKYKSETEIVKAYIEKCKKVVG